MPKISSKRCRGLGSKLTRHCGHSKAKYSKNPRVIAENKRLGEANSIKAAPILNPMSSLRELFHGR